MEGQNDIVVEKIFEDFQVSGDTWEVGYHIGKTFTGNGYAIEAVKAFLPVIMKELNITEIFGICVVENMASAKVLAKVGFSKEFEGMGSYQGEDRAICKFVYKLV